MALPPLDSMLEASNPAAFLAIALVLGTVFYLSRRLTKAPLPPGPPRHWLWGSEIPTGAPYLQYEQWTKEYGPVFSLKRGSTNIVVIGRYDAAMEIMEKQGAVLYDRPRSIAVQETLCRNMRLLMMRAGDRFKVIRRATQAQLHPRVIQSYQPLQFHNGVNLITDLLDNPSHHIDHAKRYAASVIITLTYGKPTPSDYSDPMVQQIMKFMQRFGRVVQSGTYWVDAFPILKYIPGYLTQLQKWHREELEFYHSYVNDVKEKMRRQDEVKPCFVQNLIEKKQEYDMNENEIAFLSGGLFLAGADTSAAAISITVMAAACFPEAQAKVQAQLDAVVGKHRLPSFSDEVQLPWVTAFVLECYRWRPVTAAGFPHRAMKDIIWRGYRIPEGATVIGSHWSIGRSPDYFPDPENFKPERWLDAGGNLRDDIKSLNFGFGRRVCPGQQLANKSLFVTTASMLWAFRISQDEKAPIDTLAFTQHANLHPLPFKANFAPRLPPAELRHILSEST